MSPVPIVGLNSGYESCTDCGHGYIYLYTSSDVETQTVTRWQEHRSLHRIYQYDNDDDKVVLDCDPNFLSTLVVFKDTICVVSDFGIVHI